MAEVAFGKGRLKYQCWSDEGLRRGDEGGGGGGVGCVCAILCPSPSPGSPSATPTRGPAPTPEQPGCTACLIGC